MPLPKPKDNEEQSTFVSRCMDNDTIKKEYPDQKQRLAVCFSQFRRRKKGEDMKDFITIPVDNKVAVDVDTKVITISDRLGIDALYTFNRKKIIEYYFNKEKEWDEEKAVEWYNEHKSVEPQPEEQAKKFFKVDNEKRIVYGVALVPYEVDLQGDILTEESIEEAVHLFAKSFQDVGAMHTRVTGLGTMLETYVAPVDFEMNGVKVKKGSWVLVTEASQNVWEKIKNNELVGYSIEYEGERTPIEI